LIDPKKIKSKKERVAALFCKVQQNSLYKTLLIHRKKARFIL